MPSQDRKELIEKYGESLFAADGNTANTAQTSPAKSEGKTAAPAKKKASSRHHSGSHHHHSSSKKHSSQKSKSHKSSSHKHRSSKSKSGVKKLVRSGKYRFLTFFAKRKPISKKTEQKLRKISIITIIVIVVAILAAFVYIAFEDMDNEEKILKQADQASQSKVNQSVKQTNDNDDLANTNKERQEDANTMGHAMIIAVDPAAATLDKMAQQMDNYGYDGIIALSLRYFRNTKQYASVDSINDLSKKGWDVAIVVDTENEFKSVYDKCITSGLGIPKAVYARNARLTDTLCEKIEDKNMLMVFCTYYNDMPEDRNLIYVNVLPYNDENTKQTFLNYNEKGKNLGCVIGTETQLANYNDKAFEKMLLIIDGQKQGDENAITTVTEEIYRIKAYSKQN